MKKQREKYLWEHYYDISELNIDIPDKSLYKYMMEETKDFEDLYAINYFGKKITYKSFWHYIDMCAASFKSFGVKKGDVITICMPNTPEAAISFFAANKIGAIVNMIHPLSAEEEIKSYLNTTGSTFLVAFNGCYSKIRSIINDTDVYKVVIVSASESMPLLLGSLYTVTSDRKNEKPKNNSLYIFWKEFIRLGSSYDGDTYEEMSKDDTAVILHSGGTTGIPKSIVLANRCVIGINEQGKIFFDIAKPKENVLSVLPLFHCFGLFIGMFLPICRGVVCVLVPQFDAKKFDKLMTKYNPNYIIGVPTLFEAFLKNDRMDKLDLSYLKCLVAGGDTLSEQKCNMINDFLKNHNCNGELIQGYGMTETSGPVTFGNRGSNKPGSVGAPLPGNVIRIIDPETNKECKVGETGEICVSGFVTMTEYLNDKETTKNTLILHDDGRYYIHSGDLGHIDKDGVVFYESRIKRIIISSGYNIYPQYVETVLKDHPYVKDACVVGIPHPYKQEIAKALIILEDGIEETYTVKKEIMDYAKKNLANYMLPREYIYRKEFPKTKLLKTDYKKLTEELTNK